MRPNVFRIRAIFFCIVACALVFVFRLYMLQIVNAQEYRDIANRQYTSPSNQIFDRGIIYFSQRDGDRVSAATLQSGFFLAIDPKILQNAKDAFNKISAFLPSLDEESFLAKSAKENDRYEEIIHRIDQKTGEQISALKIPGVMAFKERWRFYPGDKMAANTLGLIAYKGNELGGRYGLERFYEETLKKDESDSYANFFVKIFLNLKSNLSDSQGARGNIITSIEPSVQAFLEREIEQVQRKWNAAYTGGIIIDPKTGEIYAMAVNPSFNPNGFQEEKDPAIFSNSLVENVYEMGSIVKPLTVAAAIDANAITPATKYFDTGSVTFDKKTISNYDGKGRGLIDMQEVLNQSLNTGAAFAMSKMGKEIFSKYMFDYGLSEKTGIDLPNEAIGLVSNLKSPREIEHATASFGQGIAVSPIAIVRALSVLANGGKLISPHLATSIEYDTGLSKKIDPQDGRQVLKKETTETISKMLVKTVDTSIIEGKIKIQHYSVAAKTGTAQIAKHEGGGYYEDRFLHSFFGYFPAYDARFLVFLFMYHPKDVTFSSETLPIPFMNIAKYLINYYEIPPDR